MDKKELSITLIVAGLTVLFALAAFALFLSKGKSKFWTAKKMKLGAVILTLTATATTLQSCSCYVPGPLDYFYIDFKNDSLNLNDSSTIKGLIENPTGNVYSFKLQNDTIENEKQVENIFSDDGKFDEETEEFTIQLDTSLQSGDYLLQFFNIKKEEQDSTSYPLNEYSLKILNDNK